MHWLSCLVISAFAWSKIFCNVPKLDRRIVGGIDANINDYFYLLSLQDQESHFCGACILTEKTVLTAAHCTVGQYANQLMVRACSNHTVDGGVVAKIANIKRHPKFNFKSGDYDVAILILLTPVKNEIKLSLPPVNKIVPVGATAEVAGWGLTTENGNVAYHLQKIKTKRITDKRCNSSYNGIITSSMFCFSANWKSVCMGDSGGPLVYENILVGIVSWGRKCGDPMYPGVYVRVSDPLVHAFITDNMV